MEVTMQKLLATILFLAIAPLPIAAKPVTLVETWNPTGEPPDGCTAALTGQGVAPRWVVARPYDEGGQRPVMESTSDKTDYRFPLCILEGRSLSHLANVDVTIRFRARGGQVDQAGGIAVRLQDERNYYVVRANALEHNVRLYRVIDGNRQQFGGANAKVMPGEWHTLRLRADGELFTVYYDGNELFEAQDRRLSAPGKIALWSKADSLTEFAEIDVEPLL
jgi:hypothetical protein